MSNKFDEMKQAVWDAENTLYHADRVASDIAKLLRGRLRKCMASDLEALKRELKDFNIQTRRWKS